MAGWCFLRLAEEPCCLALLIQTRYHRPIWVIWSSFQGMWSATQDRNISLFIMWLLTGGGATGRAETDSGDILRIAIAGAGCQMEETAAVMVC